MARKYSSELSKSPVQRGDLWDIIIRQEQIILTLLQTISAVKAGNSKEYDSYEREVMDRLKELDGLRDALIYVDEA